MDNAPHTTGGAPRDQAAPAPAGSSRAKRWSIRDLLQSEFRFLFKPLTLTSRLLLLLAAFSVAASVLFPLWRLHLVAPQYPEGLRLDIYA